VNKKESSYENVEKMNAMGAADLTDTGEEAAEEEAMEPAA